MVYANKNLINLLNKFLNIYPLNFYKNILLYKKLIWIYLLKAMNSKIKYKTKKKKRKY